MGEKIESYRDLRVYQNAIEAARAYEEISVRREVFSR
jgi:hypothetical protein